MKCIVYVSRVSVRPNGAIIPIGLSEVFRVARKMNKKFNITGIMSYNNGHYIQVLEGESTAVTQLYDNIKIDSRHKDVTTLLNFNITERSFPDWNMKLMQGADKNWHFARFVERYADLILKLDQRQRRLLDLFFIVSGAGSNVELSSLNTQNYEGKDLMLSGWPDFTVIQPSPVVVELCARLTKRSTAYQSLIEGNEFGTRQQIDKILNKFQASEILKVTESVQGMPQNTQVKTRNSFHSKMRKFLGIV